MDTDLDRPRWRSTFSYAFSERLQAGVEWNPAAAEVAPLLTWFLAFEGERRPALFLGTSSDRIGSPEGTQSYFLTAAKHLPGLPLSVYASLNWSEWDGDWNVPFGATLELPRGFSLRPMYDGHRSHLLLNVDRDAWGISLLWVWLEEAGVSFSTRF